MSKNSTQVGATADGSGATDVIAAPFGNLRRGRLENIPLPPPTGTFSLYFDDNPMQNLWLAFTWGRET
jgi:hypothetical protein